MVPLRLLTFLLLLSNSLVTGTETGTQDQVPCEDDAKASANPVPAFTLDVQSTTPMTLAEGLYICKLNKYPSISSLELDQERKDYASITPDFNVEAYWVNISMNKTNGQYYWSDGVADTNMNLKPKVTDPNGAGVFTISRDPSVPGHGSLSVIPTTGEATPFVRAVICGGPGDEPDEFELMLGLFPIYVIQEIANED
ncbi:unnamed protein product [Caenorhabditis brenneri]